jgi:hypothetical protein
MIQFEYQSRDLFKSNDKYKLSSVFGEDNFFYGLFDTRTEKLVKAKNISGLPAGYWFSEEALTALLKDEKLTDPTIETSVHAISLDGFHLVPDGLSIKNQEKYFQSVSLKAGQEQYKHLVQRISDPACDLHFLAPRMLVDVVEHNADQTKVCHLNGALINKVHQYGSEDFMVVNFLGSAVQTLVFRRSKLQQTNHYSLLGEHDALYYVLLNYKVHGLDPLDHKLYYTGPGVVEDQNLMLLQQHIENIEPMAIRDRLKYSNVFLGKPKYPFFLLQSILSCA